MVPRALSFQLLRLLLQPLFLLLLFFLVVVVLLPPPLLLRPLPPVLALLTSAGQYPGISILFDVTSTWPQSSLSSAREPGPTSPLLIAR